MDERNSSPVPEWRAFEELVARIERAAGPKDATVTSPDHIPDVNSGTKREVDASIRFKVGTAPVLITIECRKRKDTQDVTWIEQLATKRDNIGAAKTIAVASKGFSQEAMKLAGRTGIVLREIEDISGEDIEDWLAPQFVLHIFKQSRLVEKPGLEYVQTAGDRRHGASPPDIENSDFNAKVFLTREGEAISLNDIWCRLQSQNDPYNLVPRQEAEGAPEGKGPPFPNVKIMVRMELSISRGDLQVQTTQGLRDVEKIILPMELWYEQEKVPIGQAAYYRYTGADGLEVQRSEMALTARNLDIKMAFQGEKDGKDGTIEAAVRLIRPNPS